MTSLGVAVNFYNEVKALPGFLEMASHFFDDLLICDCGPDGKPSNDGSLDILRDYGITPLQWSINEGFGKIRTDLIRASKTPWVVIMDCDERMSVSMPVLHCEGTEGYPAVANPNLKVSVTETSYNHREFLLHRIRDAENNGAVAVRAARRHWFDATYKRPTQNWLIIRDWQLRIWKRLDHVGYRADVKMHEQAWDFGRNRGPKFVMDDHTKGPFFDHLHCHFKPMEKDQRQYDIAIYDALHEGKPMPGSM